MELEFPMRTSGIPIPRDFCYLIIVPHSLVKEILDSSVPQIFEEIRKSNEEFLFPKYSSPRIPKQKKPSFSLICQSAACFHIEQDISITNLSFEIFLEEEGYSIIPRRMKKTNSPISQTMRNR
jgi:hypothetical protein